MNHEILSPIYRTNYTSVEPGGRKLPLSKDAVTVLKTSKDPFVLNLVQDNNGNTNLFATSVTEPQQHSEKLKTFLEVSGRELLDSVYVTTEAKNSEEVAKNFKETFGKDMPVKIVPEYPNKVVVRQNSSAAHLELQLPNQGYSWHPLKLTT